MSVNLAQSLDKCLHCWHTIHLFFFSPPRKYYLSSGLSSNSSSVSPQCHVFSLFQTHHAGLSLFIQLPVPLQRQTPNSVFLVPREPCSLLPSIVRGHIHSHGPCLKVIMCDPPMFSSHETRGPYPMERRSKNCLFPLVFLQVRVPNSVPCTKSINYFIFAQELLLEIARELVFPSLSFSFSSNSEDATPENVQGRRNKGG